MLPTRLHQGEGRGALAAAGVAGEHHARSVLGNGACVQRVTPGCLQPPQEREQPGLLLHLEWLVPPGVNKVEPGDAAREVHCAARVVELEKDALAVAQHPA